MLDMGKSILAMREIGSLDELGLEIRLDSCFYKLDKIGHFLALPE